jgi:two-component system, OmpR family, sensor histidine kinase CpxA
MKVRIPLSVKIIVWFFLNLIFLGLVCYSVFRMQFRMGMDWLLSGQADERIQAVSEVIGAELEDKARTEWDDVLKRFSTAYQVQFFLFRGDGAKLAGEEIELPPELRMRISAPRSGPPPFGQGGRGFGPNSGTRIRRSFGNPGESLEAFGPPGQARPVRFSKSILTTTHPKRYWALVRMPSPEAGPERSAFSAVPETLGGGVRERGFAEFGRERMLPATLVLMSPSITGAGLFFDMTPWLIAGSAVLLISVVFWFPLVRGITHSLGQMTHATEQIAEGRFDFRVDESRSDELGSLGQAVNRMAARLSGFVAGQKRFLGDIAHELCSPIARIQMGLGILEQRADAKQKAYVEDVREEVQHMSSLVNELLSFSKASLGGSAIKLQSVDVRQVVQRAIEREALETAGIVVDLKGDLVVAAEPDLLLRALANLLRNAMRYAGHAGPITISAAQRLPDVIITITDCGPGIPEEALNQIFDPFYRLDSSRARETGGVGLGLAIVKACVESCGGTVSCHNRQPSGLLVSIKLPAASTNPP